jgi:hypothetical protein
MSIVGLQVCFRLGQIPISFAFNTYFNRNLDLKILNQSKWFDRLIKADLQRDKNEHLISFYKPSHILYKLWSAYP